MCGAHTRVAALVAALVAGDLRKPVSSVKKPTNACKVCKEKYECLERDVRMPVRSVKRRTNAWKETYECMESDLLMPGTGGGQLCARGFGLLSIRVERKI